MKKKNLIECVCAEVAGFNSLYELIKQRMSISGKSESILENYSHHVVKMALH